VPFGYAPADSDRKADRLELFVPVRNAAFGEVVRRELDVDAVAHKDADAIAAHAARDRREHHVVGVVDLDLKISVGLFVDDDAGHFDQFFFHSLAVGPSIARDEQTLRMLYFEPSCNPWRAPIGG